MKIRKVVGTCVNIYSIYEGFKSPKAPFLDSSGSCARSQPNRTCTCMGGGLDTRAHGHVPCHACKRLHSVLRAVCGQYAQGVPRASCRSACVVCAEGGKVKWWKHWRRGSCKRASPHIVTCRLSEAEGIQVPLVALWRRQSRVTVTNHKRVASPFES